MHVGVVGRDALSLVLFYERRGWRNHQSVRVMREMQRERERESVRNRNPCNIRLTNSVIKII